MQTSRFKNIQYYTSGKGSKFIVFLHGNSLSSATFKNQMRDVSLNRFKLLAIDFPGHGKSGKPQNKEDIYSITGFRDVVIDFINQQNIGDFIFAGHSLGGHVAIECLPFVENCKGIMIWGSPPVKLPLEASTIYEPHPDLGLFFQPQLSQQEIKRLSENTVAKENAGNMMKIIRQADPEFRAILPISHSKDLISDEFEILKQSSLPKAILHGDEDPFVKTDYLESLQFPNVYNDGIQYITDAGHTPQMDQPDIFNKILLNFATGIFGR